MSERDSDGFVARLLRWITPVVRTCLLVGMIIGGLLGLYFGLGGPKDEAANIVVERPESRVVPWIIGGWILLGGCLGAAAGFGVQAMFAESDKADKSKPWWKARKAARRKR
jgi:hypothetical protein